MSRFIIPGGSVLTQGDVHSWAQMEQGKLDAAKRRYTYWNIATITVAVVVFALLYLYYFFIAFPSGIFALLAAVALKALGSFVLQGPDLTRVQEYVLALVRVERLADDVKSRKVALANSMTL